VKEWEFSVSMQGVLLYFEEDPRKDTLEQAVAFFQKKNVFIQGAEKIGVTQKW